MAKRIITKQTINILSRYAEKLKENLDDLKEPLVIEISGTPRSGKSLSIESLRAFFDDNKINVAIVPEQASFCPIPEKSDYFFNIWTGCQTLSKFVDYLRNQNNYKYDVILLNRGIFDILVWLNFHNNALTYNVDLVQV